MFTKGDLLGCISALQTPVRLNQLRCLLSERTEYQKPSLPEIYEATVRRRGMKGTATNSETFLRMCKHTAEGKYEISDELKQSLKSMDDSDIIEVHSKYEEFIGGLRKRWDNLNAIKMALQWATSLYEFIRQTVIAKAYQKRARSTGNTRPMGHRNLAKMCACCGKAISLS